MVARNASTPLLTWRPGAGLLIQGRAKELQWLVRLLAIGSGVPIWWCVGPGQAPLWPGPGGCCSPVCAGGWDPMCGRGCLWPCIIFAFSSTVRCYKQENTNTLKADCSGKRCSFKVRECERESGDSSLVLFEVLEVRHEDSGECWRVGRLGSVIWSSGQSWRDARSCRRNLTASRLCRGLRSPAVQQWEGAVCVSGVF